MNKLDSSSPSLLTRSLDAIDRGHARTAMRLHEVRNELIAVVSRLLDHAESTIERARKGIKRVDAVSADVVNRAQGAVGQAIEKARHARSMPEHVTS